MYEKNNLYKMNFKFFETSLNIQNGGAHSSNVNIYSVVHNFLNSPPILFKFVSNSLFVKFFTLKHKLL